MTEWIVIFYAAITFPLCLSAAIANRGEAEDGPGEFLTVGLWPLAVLLVVVLWAALAWERLTHSEGE